MVLVRASYKCAALVLPSLGLQKREVHTLTSQHLLTCRALMETSHYEVTGTLSSPALLSLDTKQHKQWRLGRVFIKVLHVCASSYIPGTSAVAEFSPAALKAKISADHMTLSPADTKKRPQPRSWNSPLDEEIKVKNPSLHPRFQNQVEHLVG